VNPVLLSLIRIVLKIVNICGESIVAAAKQKVHEIIHAAADACAEAEGDSAQSHQSESVAIIPIQADMILAIASEHGIEISNAAAADLLRTFSATVQSRQVLFSRQALVGWLPGIDSVADESTTAGLTEAIGWAANSYFEQKEANQSA
jgi:uncharacterized protein (DUF697 family)